MNNYKGVLFDLDGTLADNYTAIHKCTCAVFTEYGVPLPSYEKVFKTVWDAMKMKVTYGNTTQNFIQP